MTLAVIGLEIVIHAIQVPAKEFLLLMPRQRTLRRERVIEDRLPLLLEPKQHFGWKRACLSEGDEIRPAFSLQMRQHSARVQSCDEMGFVIRVSHARSAGVPACE